jgi:5-methylcytosine-specific restriction endonuclease McrA
MEEFYEVTPTLDNYWRSIVLFGRNVASYKFALARSLLEFKDRGDDLIRLDELATPFSRNVCEHLTHSPKQATSKSSKFIDSCRKFNAEEIGPQELDKITVQLGFNNVIDAFHVVNQGAIPELFFIDERKENKGIRLTENLFELLGSEQATAFAPEVEARWRLVETAWELNISRDLIAVSYEPEREFLTANKGSQRIGITSCRDALNGYQKGLCFYCFRPISIVPGNDELADVDHFFPHALKGTGVAEPVDGVWNLVLACSDCNRGEGGKFARMPKLGLLRRLKKRNDYLINSHHPLRETLIGQTGSTTEERDLFLQKSHSDAKRILIHTWEPSPEHDPTF